MGQIGGSEVGPQAWDRPRFVADLTRCLADWERALTPATVSHDAAFTALIDESGRLCERSKGLGFGGIGVHLEELMQRGRNVTAPAAARDQLGVVRQMLDSARQSLSAEEAAWQPPSPAAAAAPSFGDFAPPPLLSMAVRSPLAAMPAAAQAPPPPAPPAQAPPLAAPAPIQPPSPAQFSAVAPAAGFAPPRSLLESQMVKAPLPAAPAPGPAPAAQAAPFAPPASPFAAPYAPPAPALAPQQAPPLNPMGHAPPAMGHVPPAAARPGQPNLGVRPLLGLKGFGNKPASAAAPSAPVPASPGQQSSMLGLQRGGPSAPPPALSSLSSSHPAPPPAVGLGYGGLPSVERDSAPPPARYEGRSARKSLPIPRSEEPEPRTPSAGEPARRQRRRFEPPAGQNRSWLPIAAGFGVVLVGAVIFIVVMATRKSDATESTTAGGSGSADPAASGASSSAADLPRSRLLTEDERFKALLGQVHGRGGKESPELRALIDEHAALAAEALSSKGCQGANCKALLEVGKVVQSGPKIRVKRRSRSPDALRSKWLAGLTMPEIAVEDDPRVQRQFEFYTENPQGRETFQQMLFRCGEYQDYIQSALIRHGLPPDLIAVVYAESSCYPLAKSKVGAEGLWQFIPEAARAYHLRIIADQVDERHSPQKATDAAIRFLKDMHTKLNDWDLVFAGYNCGPFGVMARLARVEGDNVGFWELVDAGMLPDETANYAPAIQAIALILNNLQRLKFAGTQRRAPQLTAELTVPPGTRLSLVARASAMSLQELLRMNLDIKGMSTPNVANFVVHVPKDNVWQARETLGELLKSGDASDQCAPATFDWGRQRFTAEMAQACARSQATQAPQKQ